MGDRHYLHLGSRTLAVRVPRTGFVFRPRGGLVDESAAKGPAKAGRPIGSDGLVAAPSLHAGHSALGSRLSIYRREIPTISGGASGHLQHERGGQLRR